MAAQIQCAFSVYNVITVIKYIKGLVFVSYKAQYTLGNMLLATFVVTLIL